MTTSLLGDLEEGERLLRQAISVSREHDMLEPLGFSLGIFTEVQDWKGAPPGSPDAGDALHRGIEVVEIADRTGIAFLRCTAYRSLATGHLVNEHWSDAIDAAGKAKAIAREDTGLEWEADYLALLSRGHLGQGDHEAAIAFAREAVAVAQRRRTRFIGAVAEVALARALRAARGLEAADEIEACLDQLDLSIQETGGRVLAPQAIEERAWLAELRGDAEAASVRLREAHQVYREIGAQGHAARVAKLLAARPA